MSDPERCYPDGEGIREGEMIDGWCSQCGHLKLAHHISGQCAACQIIVESRDIKRLSQALNEQAKRRAARA